MRASQPKLDVSFFLLSLGLLGREDGRYAVGDGLSKIFFLPAVLWLWSHGKPHTGRAGR